MLRPGCLGNKIPQIGRVCTRCFGSLNWGARFLKILIDSFQMYILSGGNTMFQVSTSTASATVSLLQIIAIKHIK